MKTSFLPASLLLLATLSVGAATEGSPDRLERPGVVADRAARTVRVEARATGLEPGVKTEFFLIAPNSGHDYEAVAVSRAIPSDVHAALEFIGIPAGRAVNRDALHYWPKGERVIVHLLREDGSRIRLEDSIMDLQTGNTTPRDGFVFTGSLRIPDLASSNPPPATVYAADRIEPNSIISAFNLRTTVLDIPRLGTQTELYERQVSHEGATYRKDEPLVFLLEPEPRDPPGPRVLDLQLAVLGEPPAEPARFDVLDAASKRLAGPVSAEAALEDITTRQAGNRDVCLRFAVAKTATLRHAEEGAKQVRALLQKGLVKPEPPEPGQLYYSAFLPNPKLRQRELHSVHPWELRLVRAESRWTLNLTRITLGMDEAGEKALQVETVTVETPASAVAHIREKGSGLPSLLVFAPAGMPFGEFSDLVLPFQATHPHIFVYAE
jgi:hypothetical protein